MLAALDNNFNTERKQKVSKVTSSILSLKVRKHFRVAYRKPSKKFIARKVYEKKSYQFKKDIMTRTMEKAAAGLECLAATKRKTMAPMQDRPSKSFLIEQYAKHSRFK